MRVLLTTIGSRGYVQPLVALATEIEGLGHEARLCVPPDFQSWISDLGLSVTPIGPEVRRAAAARPSGAPPTPPSPQQVREMMDAMVGGQFETVFAAAHGCDAVLAATAVQPATRSVAEALGVPYVFVAYCPRVLPSAKHAPLPLPPRADEASLPGTSDNGELWARDAARFQDTFGASLNAVRTAQGLPAIEHVRDHMFTNRPWLAADPVLAPWPDPGEPSVFQSGAWLLRDDRPLPDEVTSFLDAGEPPIYFGLGSTHASPDLTNTMLAAARALGRRSIVSRGWADLSVAGSHADCLLVDDLNFAALFARVATAVHHGGAGTTTAAALAGASQVVLPHVYDQQYWAERVGQLGIGAGHAAGAVTTASLTGALEQALSSTVVQRARSAAGNIRRDGAKKAAVRLLEVAGSAPRADT